MCDARSFAHPEPFADRHLRVVAAVPVITVYEAICVVVLTVLTAVIGAHRHTVRVCPWQALLAKLFAGDTAMWVSERAVQVLGGYGYTTDFPVERFFRDAKITQIYEGTQEVQRIVINRSISP